MAEPDFPINGSRLRERRKEAGLSMHALAERVGFTAWQSIQRIESGRTKSSPKRARLAEALGVSVDWLAGVSLNSTPPRSGSAVHVIPRRDTGYRSAIDSPQPTILSPAVLGQAILRHKKTHADLAVAIRNAVDEIDREIDWEYAIQWASDVLAELIMAHQDFPTGDPEREEAWLRSQFPAKLEQIKTGLRPPRPIYPVKEK